MHQPTRSPQQLTAGMMHQPTRSNKNAKNGNLLCSSNWTTNRVISYLIICTHPPRYLYMSVISSGKVVSLWCLNPIMNGCVKPSYLQGKCYGCARLTANYKHAYVGILLCACFLYLADKEWASFLAFVLSTPKNSSCKKLP